MALATVTEYSFLFVLKEHKLIVRRFFVVDIATFQPFKSLFRPYPTIPEKAVYTQTTKAYSGLFNHSTRGLGVHEEENRRMLHRYKRDGKLAL